MKWILSIFAVLLILIGLVWMLQGVNVLMGSVMSGHFQYTFIGLVVVAIGIVILISANRRPGQKKDQPK
jgi:hypothetical protein